MEWVKALDGHSGARVDLCRDAGRYFVRKRATDPARNVRLAAQADKQVEARGEGLRCPAVLRRGDDGGLFFFDMDYVSGDSVAHLARDGAISFDPARFRSFLATTLQHYCDRPTGRIRPSDIRDKLETVEARALAQPRLAELHGGIRRVAADLREWPWPEVDQTTCHGDLTLENILVTTDDDFALIDFDAVELSSGVLDAAKLMQDTVGLWCLRKLAVQQPNSIDFLNARMNLKWLENEIATLGRTLFPQHTDHLPRMAALHLMRTLPYTTDKAEAVFTLQNIMSLLTATRAGRMAAHS